MTPNEALGEAIYIATVSHHQQTDKAGKPYILHPLHLMQQFLYDPELAAIAVLHDVIEDTEIELGDLDSFGFSERVLSALALLTHSPGQTYESYIADICLNIDAIRVKRKDLQHNSDITRLKGVTRKDFDRIEKYHLAFVKLTEAKRNFNNKG